MKKMFLILGLSLGVFVANAQTSISAGWARTAYQISEGNEQALKNVVGLSIQKDTIIGEQGDTTRTYVLQGGYVKFTILSQPKMKVVTYEESIYSRGFDGVTTSISVAKEVQKIMEYQQMVTSTEGSNDEKTIVVGANIKKKKFYTLTVCSPIGNRNWNRVDISFSATKMY